MNSGAVSGREALLVAERFEDFLFADTVVSGHLAGRVSGAEPIENYIRSHSRFGEDRTAKGDPRIDGDHLWLLGGSFRSPRKWKQPDGRAARAAFDSSERTLEFASECRLPAARDADELRRVFEEQMQAIRPKIFGEQRARRLHVRSNAFEGGADALQRDAMVPRYGGEHVKLAEVREREQTTCGVGRLYYRLKGLQQTLPVAVALAETPGKYRGVRQLEQVRNFACAITRRIED